MSKENLSDYDIVLKRVAKKLDMPEYVVFNVTNSIFGFINDMVHKGEYEGFYFKYLGKLVVKPFRLKEALRIKELHLEKLKREEDV